MPTRIEGLTVVNSGFRRRHSALRLAVAATGESIRRAGMEPAGIDLLINVGVYRDGNLGEPALAPLIQNDAGVNAGDPAPGGVGTFSFDISNGSCGVLTALQVADGFLRSRTIRTAVIVASDADPGHGLAPDFPFTPAGGAMVCRSADDGRGVAGFRWHDEPDGGTSFRSTVAFEDGSNLLTVVEEPAFAERAAEAAATAAGRLLSEHGISVGRIDVVVAAPDRPTFTKVLGDRLRVPAERIVSAGPGLHTVSLIAALDRAQQEARLPAGATVLIVCAGAGVTAGAALYRV